MLSVELVDCNDSDQLTGDWNSLRRNEPQRYPILDLEFFRLLLKYFGSGKERMVVVRDSGECLAVGIIHTGTSVMWQTFQPSQAPLGPWLIKHEADERLYSGLMQQLPLPCLGLGITQQDSQVVGVREVPANVRVLPYIDVARLAIPDDFDQYWSGRGKNLRNNLRRQFNKLSREAIVAKTEIIADPSGVRSSVREYAQIESQGWKATQGTALEPGNAQEAFYIEVMTHYAEHGEARAYVMKLNGKTAAIDLCLYRHGTLIVLKTTHDEEIDKLSPSMLLKHEMIRTACETEGFRSIEFYGKVMDWHRRLTNDMRPIFHVNLFRSNFLAKLSDYRGSVVSRWGSNQ